jgi:preprotein translocase subunit YajC
MSIEIAFFVWLLVCYFFLVWRVERRQRRVNSLRDELGIVSKFHDKPIPFNKNSK